MLMFDDYIVAMLLFIDYSSVAMLMFIDYCCCYGDVN